MANLVTTGSWHRMLGTRTGDFSIMFPTTGLLQDIFLSLGVSISALLGDSSCFSPCVWSDAVKVLDCVDTFSLDHLVWTKAKRDNNNKHNDNNNMTISCISVQPIWSSYYSGGKSTQTFHLAGIPQCWNILTGPASISIKIKYSWCTVAHCRIMSIIRLELLIYITLMMQLIKRSMETWTGNRRLADWSQA